MAGALLRATDVTMRRHGARRDGPASPLIDNVSLDIGEGERVAVIGRSGSGKSLLAGALSGTVPATLSISGTVTFDGRAVTARTVGDRGIVVVRQDSADALNPLVMVAEQMGIPLRVRGVDSTNAAEFLRRVGMDDPERILHSYPGELSGGQRQRVCVALGLACAPRLLITDESTTALDVINQAVVVEALGGVETLVFITHDLALAAQLCTRVLVMEAGRIVEDASLTEVLGNPVRDITRSLVEQAKRRGGWVA
ncbi:ATP-binding cassette domain-containing protein [Corynebacterium pacaense]|uniref:ATP-binding cassette domain-containing protein n=1 Tax=Corynebacterium pacaense TaxID=1816684 RepID=UPI0015C4E64F|nr:ATP-binding cassette domain-containing protein [Corynebacterium pacaense]